mmetsp:Transcript_144858/g.464277  ORF Transcript_144858/g.464277 Transcript_144858/m.464277 type:complete len:619 (+) Transcript_144858:910-2766(+)
MPQDLVTTSWSFAMLEMRDLPLFDAIAASSHRILLDFGPQHLALSAWALATLFVRDCPLIDAIAACAVPKIAEFGSPACVGTVAYVESLGVGPCQDLSILAWSFAALGVFNRPLLAALSSASISKMRQFSPQNLSNTAWAVANLRYPDGPLLDAIAEASVPLMANFDGQNLANTSWAFAKLAVTNTPLMEALSAASILKIQAECQPQELANIAWSFAALLIIDEPFFDAMAKESVLKMENFDVQNLANTAWSYAAVVLRDQPLLDALSEAALAKISEYTLQELSNTAWACATLSEADVPLLAAIASKASATMHLELEKAISRSRAELRGDLEAAQLFFVNAGELAWSFNFMSQAGHPLLCEVSAACLDLGRAFDRNHPLWPPHPDVRPALGPAAWDAARPSIPWQLRGMCLVVKPPGWEVDTEGDSGILHLSGFLQVALQPSQRAVAFRPDFSFGFVHRLDTPSSGLILTGTSFEGYACLEMQMYTYEIVREYYVLGRGAALCSQLDVCQRIFDGRASAQVSEHGRPARSHIRCVASSRGGPCAEDAAASEEQYRPAQCTASREAFCQVAIQIFTGRRHQIRVHMQHSDIPSIADGRYGLNPTIFLRPSRVGRPRRRG